MPSEPQERLATAKDHRVIDGVSHSLGGQVGRDDDIDRLMLQIINGPCTKELHTACEIAVAFIRWSQDLKNDKSSLRAERDELKEKLEEAREQASDINLERERAVMTAKSMMGRWGTLCKALDRAEAAGVIEGPVCQSELEMATVMDRAGEYKQRCERLERALREIVAELSSAHHFKGANAKSVAVAALAAVESEGQDAGQQTTQN